MKHRSSNVRFMASQAGAIRNAALCGWCGRVVPLTADGLLAMHMIPPAERHLICPATGATASPPPRLNAPRRVAGNASTAGESERRSRR